MPDWSLLLTSPKHIRLQRLTTRGKGVLRIRDRQMSLYDAPLAREASARTSAVHVSLSSDSIVKQQTDGITRSQAAPNPKDASSSRQTSRPATPTKRRRNDFVRRFVGGAAVDGHGIRSAAYPVKRHFQAVPFALDPQPAGAWRPPDRSRA